MATAYTSQLMHNYESSVSPDMGKTVAWTKINAASNTVGVRPSELTKHNITVAATASLKERKTEKLHAMHVKE